jgi:hypothetical protein
MRHDDARQRMTRNRKDNTHYGKAFEASCKLSAAEARLANDKLSSSTRKRLTNTVRDETNKLKNLTERDHEMTCVLREYLRQHGGTMRSYEHFFGWCTDLLNDLDKRDEQGRLNNAEREIFAALKKLTELDVRTIQYRLQNQFGAHGLPGERGRPGKLR